jgi:FtsP/CotA-like multicopper oxidase with cupredoxin domain
MTCPYPSKIGLAASLLSLLVAADASAQTKVNPVPNPCSRMAAGSVVSNPPTLSSQNGVLSVNFSYQTTKDADGRQLYCFMTPSGLENPTFHLKPGDHLVINVTNNVPESSGMSMAVSSAANQCGAVTMTNTSVNIHYHGTNTSPTCHSDEVIHTLINTGESFRYNVAFPSDEPPGLYWYHPHVHGIAEAAVLGGASGAIVVDGLEDIQPAVSGLADRLLLIRDQNVAGNPKPGGAVPSWDVTLNYVPIPYPALTAAVIQMRPGEKQLWRVGNLCADTILDLQLVFDGNVQQLQVVGLDGVPVGSQDGTRQGKIVNTSHLRLPPASRAEFIVTGPSEDVGTAVFQTQAIVTGPNGDNDTARTLAVIHTTSPQTTAASKPAGAATTTTLASPATQSPTSGSVVPASTGVTWKQRFEGLETADITARRVLYFSENDAQTQFFITVDGQTPTPFDPTLPPAVTTKQGSVEEWVIQNRAKENHEFHFHQLHFLVESQDNFEANGSQPAPAIQGQLLDMIELPYWDGTSAFPSVRLRIDFRGPDVGDFVYHCHILNHEDQGMMAIIRVLPAGSTDGGATSGRIGKR